MRLPKVCGCERLSYLGAVTIEAGFGLACSHRSTLEDPVWDEKLSLEAQRKLDLVEELPR